MTYLVPVFERQGYPRSIMQNEEKEKEREGRL